MKYTGITVELEHPHLISNAKQVYPHQQDKDHCAESPARIALTPAPAGEHAVIAG
jgi:hypothetical protein